MLKSSFNKVDSNAGFFLVNFTKFFRAPNLENIYERLLLKFVRILKKLFIIINNNWNKFDDSGRSIIEMFEKC